MNDKPVPTLRGPRVVLRAWADSDLAPFAALNADPEVMRHLSKRLSADESDAMVERIRAHFAAHGFGLWAIDVPDIGFAGFVGLAQVPFELDAAGIVAHPHEIGWRLARAAWGRGYATEGARLALAHAFEMAGLPQVVSFTALANVASQAVMRRIALTRRGEFDHPRMASDHPLRRQVLYALESPALKAAA